MSYVPESHLQGQNLIVQYLVEFRGRGHFLPYDDHLIIRRWLERCDDADTLLLVLADFIPAFYGKNNLTAQPPSLKRLDRKVTKILEAKQQRL